MMSENQQIMNLLELVLKKMDKIENKIQGKDIPPAILNIESFTKYFHWAPSTQAKWRTSKEVVENIPYSNIGGITYATKDIYAFFERHGLNKQ